MSAEETDRKMDDERLNVRCRKRLVNFQTGGTVRTLTPGGGT